MPEDTDADLVEEQGVNGDAPTPSGAGDPPAAAAAPPAEDPQPDGTGNGSLTSSGGGGVLRPGQELSAGEG